MTDATAPKPDGWKVTQGFIFLTILAFVILAAAGLGWHAGVALARVLGL
jgi:hypothetical protein